MNLQSLPVGVQTLAGLQAPRLPNEAPMPLMREMPDPESFPIDSLGPIVGSAARTLQRVIQAPDAVCGQSMLAACTVAVQSQANVVIDGREYPVSNYFLSVAESGERKSAVDNLALKAVREYERELAEKYQDAFSDFQDGLEIYETERKRVLQAKSRQEKESGLADLGDKPNAPLSPILLLGDPTYEGLLKLLSNGMPAIGLFSDEGGKFFGGHGMAEDQQLKTAAGLSSLWDGKPVDRIRAGDGSSKLFGRRLSGHLMIQPVVAEQLFSNRVLGGQGFLARCLTSQPKSTAGTRPYQEINIEHDPTLGRYHRRISEILHTPMPLEEGKLNELKPRQLTISGAAKSEWISFHDAVEKNLSKEGAFATIRAFGSKAPEHCLRIAGVLTLAEDIEAGAITSQALEAAITITRFYLGEAIRIAGSAGLDPDLMNARDLLGWLKGRQVIDLPTIYQFGPRAIRERKGAMRAVKVLEDHRWLTRIQGGMEIEGKQRRDVWRVHESA